ncbi:MAG: YerC/YecD family TrpR-related protein [Patescibacteria group bacterium]
MTTFHLNNLPKQNRIQMIGEFYDMIDSLKDRNEVRLFIKSLMTADEIATLMRRIEIAVLLSGKYTYNEITKLLGAGNGKITNVQKNLLQDDSGYKIIVKRLIENRKERLKRIKNEEKRASDSSPLGNIKKFNPASRILPNLLDAVIKKLEDDKELEKEALIFTPSLKHPRNK